MASFSPRDMYRTSTSMLRPFAAACLVVVASLGWTAFAAAQVPNTFNNGEVADADKINENFSYVLENASGGCTVEQVDNTAEITCADGSTAVVPGYGTVVVYPEGGIVGDSPPVSWPTGEIIYVDSNDVILAAAKSLVGVSYADLLPYKANFYNNVEAQKVGVTAWGGGVDAYYLSSDCTGQAFGGSSGYLYDIDGQLLVQSNTIESSQLLVRSYKRSGYARGFVYTPTKACATFTSAESGVKPLIDYTPAPEILNAAYPVWLEQLP